MSASVQPLHLLTPEEIAALTQSTPKLRTPFTDKREICLNCRFWHVGEPLVDGVAVGACGNGMVCKPYTGLMHQKEMTRSGVLLEDLEGPQEFFTGPDFGCIHFEVKP